MPYYLFETKNKNKKTKQKNKKKQKQKTKTKTKAKKKTETKNLMWDESKASHVQGKLEVFYLWGPVASGVLLRLYGLGLWPDDPIRGC